MSKQLALLTTYMPTVIIMFQLTQMQHLVKPTDGITSSHDVSSRVSHLLFNTHTQIIHMIATNTSSKHQMSTQKVSEPLVLTIAER